MISTNSNFNANTKSITNSTTPNTTTNNKSIKVLSILTLLLPMTRKTDGNMSDAQLKRISEYKAGTTRVMIDTVERRLLKPDRNMVYLRSNIPS